MEQHKHPWLESISLCSCQNGMKHVYDNVSSLIKIWLKVWWGQDCAIHMNRKILLWWEGKFANFTWLLYVYQHQRYISIIKKPQLELYSQNYDSIAPSWVCFPSRRIYCSIKIADIEHVPLECRETKSLAGCIHKTMNDKCCEFRLAKNKKQITMMPEIKFYIKHCQCNWWACLKNSLLLWIANTYMHVQKKCIQLRYYHFIECTMCETAFGYFSYDD